MFFLKENTTNLNIQIIKSNKKVEKFKFKLNGIIMIFLKIGIK